MEEHDALDPDLVGEDAAPLPPSLLEAEGRKGRKGEQLTERPPMLMLETARD